MSNINQRVRLDVPTPAMGVLQWPSRPVFLDGNEAWSYLVKGSTSKFAITIGNIDKAPFEVWILANEQPRGLGAIAKSLSADMWVRDSKWLDKKLDILASITGGNQIDQSIFAERLVASSNSAVIAKVIRAWCAHNGSPSCEGTPLCDMLLPTSAARRTLAYTVSIQNPYAKDDFLLFMPEAETEDGQTIPTGVSLSGQYPSDLDGLTALLSLDMRVSDVAWIGMKLRKLLKYEEPMESFLAKNPETGEQERFPSTVAYIASVMLNRYVALGLLDSQGLPIQAKEEKLLRVA